MGNSKLMTFSHGKLKVNDFFAWTTQISLRKSTQWFAQKVIPMVRSESHPNGSICFLGGAIREGGGGRGGEWRGLPAQICQSMIVGSLWMGLGAGLPMGVRHLSVYPGSGSPYIGGDASQGSDEKLTIFDRVFSAILIIFGGFGYLASGGNPGKC